MEVNFDSIRSYRDEEVPAILRKLTEEKQFMNVLATVFPLLPKEALKQRLLSFRSVSDFQKGLDYPFLKGLEETKTKGVKLLGTENIEASKSYVYVSNHRHHPRFRFLLYKIHRTRYGHRRDCHRG